MNEIREIPVVRDEYGCWTHPEYEKFCDGREHISTEEFNAWMDEIIFNGPSELWMKMILIWTQMVPILPPGNRSARKVKAGSLVPFMTLKMVLFVYG